MAPKDHLAQPGFETKPRMLLSAPGQLREVPSTWCRVGIHHLESGHGGQNLTGQGEVQKGRVAVFSAKVAQRIGQASQRYFDEIS